MPCEDVFELACCLLSEEVGTVKHKLESVFCIVDGVPAQPSVRRHGTTPRMVDIPSHELCQAKERPHLRLVGVEDLVDGFGIPLEEDIEHLKHDACGANVSESFCRLPAVASQELPFACGGVAEVDIVLVRAEDPCFTSSGT